MTRFRFLFYTTLFVAGQFVHANTAGSVIWTPPDCNAPCTAQYKACFDLVKDSPNDIERELCDNERKGCAARCEAEIKALSKEYAQKELQEKQEQASKGLNSRERNAEYEEDLDKADREEKERQDRAAREQQEKAAQEREEGTLNGNINIIKFN